MWGKIVRNPVLLAGLILVVLESFVAVADVRNLVDETVSGWLHAAVVVITALLAFLARAGSTALSDPRTADGRPAVLVPVEQIQLAEHKAIEHATALRKAEEGAVRDNRAGQKQPGWTTGGGAMYIAPVGTTPPDELRHRKF